MTINPYLQRELLGPVRPHSQYVSITVFIVSPVAGQSILRIFSSEYYRLKVTDDVHLKLIPDVLGHEV